MFSVRIWRALFLLGLLNFPSFILSQTRLKDFKGSNQRLALIDLHIESVDSSVADQLKTQLREGLSQYSEIFSAEEIQDFRSMDNPGNQYFKPSETDLSAVQKEFLLRTAKDNQVDIVVLASARETFEGIEVYLQLFDARIQEKSGVELEVLSVRNRQEKLDELVFRTMNHLDRDGFVNPEPQDFLEKPINLGGSVGLARSPIFESEDFVRPEDLAAGFLEDQRSIGGDRTPFWEKWWFWTLIGGGMVTAGGLTYYFLVVDQPPNRVNLNFNNLPRQ